MRRIFLDWPYCLYFPTWSNMHFVSFFYGFPLTASTYLLFIFKGNWSRLCYESLTFSYFECNIMLRCAVSYWWRTPGSASLSDSLRFILLSGLNFTQRFLALLVAVCYTFLNVLGSHKEWHNYSRQPYAVVAFHYAALEPFFIFVFHYVICVVSTLWYDGC